MEQNVQPIPIAELCFLESALRRQRLLSQSQPQLKKKFN